jgi:hypothetical protein
VPAGSRPSQPQPQPRTPSPPPSCNPLYGRRVAVLWGRAEREASKELGEELERVVGGDYES